MIYSRNEILLEATQLSDLTKIAVSADMVFENFLFEFESAETEEYMCEAVSGMIQTTKKMISSMIAKIKEFLVAKRQAFNEYIRKRNLRKLMSSDFRTMLKTLEKQPLDKKYTTQDMLALKKISEKYTDLIDKYVSEMESQIDNLVRTKFGRDKAFEEKVRKIESYAKNVNIGIKKLEKEAENVRTVILTPEMIYKYVEAGIRSEDDIVEIQHTVETMERKFNDIVETTNAKINEKRNVDTFGGHFGKLKTLLHKATTTINECIHSHSKLISMILKGISTISGIFASLFGPAAITNMGMGYKFHAKKYAKVAVPATILSATSNVASEKLKKMRDEDERKQLEKEKSYIVK